MVWVKVSLLLLGVFFLALLFRLVRGAGGFQRRFDDSSAEMARRLGKQAEPGNSP